MSTKQKYSLLFSLLIILLFLIITAITYPTSIYVFLKKTFIPASLVIIALVEILGVFFKKKYPDKITQITQQLPIKTSHLALIFLFIFSITFNLSGLLEKWTSGTIKAHTFNVVGALLPSVDANGVYTGAKCFIEYGELDSATSRRPLNAVFYGILLKLTNQNLQLTLLITALLTSLALFFASKSIYRFFGLTAAYIMLLLTSHFYLPFNGTLLTEPVGLLIGCLAFVFLLEGFYFHKIKEVLYGLLLLGIALTARAGALLVLPALVVAIAYVFRKKYFLNFKVGGLACLMVLASLFISPTLLKFVGASEGYSYQGNFSYKLYALTIGGANWVKVLEEHPYITDKPMAERPAIIYDLAEKEFKKNPSLFFKAIFKYFFEVVSNPIAFFYPCKRYLLYLESYLYISFITFFLSFFLIKDKGFKHIFIFLLIAALAIVLSHPLLAESGGYRVYAATIPINSALFAIGTGVFIQQLPMIVKKVISFFT